MLWFSESFNYRTWTELQMYWFRNLDTPCSTRTWVYISSVSLYKPYIILCIHLYKCKMWIYNNCMHMCGCIQVNACINKIYHCYHSILCRPLMVCKKTPFCKVAKFWLQPALWLFFLSCPSPLHKHPHVSPETRDISLDFSTWNSSGCPTCLL